MDQNKRKSCFMDEYRQKKIKSVYNVTNEIHNFLDDKSIMLTNQYFGNELDTTPIPNKFDIINLILQNIDTLIKINYYYSNELRILISNGNKDLLLFMITHADSLIQLKKLNNGFHSYERIYI